MKRKNHIRTPVSDSEALARAYHVSKSSSKDSFFGFFRALGKNKSACFGAVILLIFFLTAVFGPLLIDADDMRSDMANKLLGPSAEHILGTDHMGRDTLKMIIYGAREVLTVAAITAVMTLVIATVMGMLAAFTKGVVNWLLNILIDVIMTVPSLPVMMLLSMIVKANNYFTFAFVLSIWSWAGLAKAIRAQILSVMTRDYISAARILGLPTRHIIFNELLPGITSYLIMNMIFTMRNSISSAVSLMFLGMADFFATHWGMMIQIAVSKTAAIYGSSALWYFLSPIAAIAIFGMGCFFFSHGLDEVLNPRLRTE
ncbi:MAG: ABC transporter permease [Faecousia sp.]